MCRIPRKECDVQYTQSSSLCYKTTQFGQLCYLLYQIYLLYLQYFTMLEANIAFDSQNVENVPSLNDVLFPVTSINKHSISVQSTGQLVTVRGCSSFDSQTFPVALQQAMVGDYWNVSHMILMTLVIVMMTLMIMMTILMFI